MGYYTQFELYIHDGQADINAVYQRLRQIVGIEPSEPCPFLVLTNGTYIESDTAIKWYDHDDDCAEMSKHFPGVVFRLEGVGEDNGDLWTAYYKNGLCQICRAVLTRPPYDPTKLKSVSEAQRADEGVS